PTASPRPAAACRRVSVSGYPMSPNATPLRFPARPRDSAAADNAFLESLTPQSTLAEIPAWDARLPVTALGSDVDDVLRGQPTLPGVIVFDSKAVRGAISRTQFQNMMSRPFGREIILPRRISVLLEEFAGVEPMVLDLDLPVQEAVRFSLQRDKTM